MKKKKPGPAARMIKEDRVVVKSISIKPSLYAELERLALSANISVSALVSALIIKQIGV